MTFPDFPHIPELPAHRVANMTQSQILNQARAALHAAHQRLHQLEVARMRHTSSPLFALP